MKILRERKAVAPVIATLLMIAVAVAMSVIIFMWSQGFLSQTSSSTGGQQGAQNQAAQSSVSIEIGTFTSGSSSTGCTSVGTCTITLVVRNVGAVAINLGSITITGISSNVGFKGSLSVPTAACSAGAIAYYTSGTYGGTCSGNGDISLSSSSSTHWSIKSSGATSGIAKGGSVAITLENAQTEAAVSTTTLLSGDVISAKVTTAVGTFAQSQFTVP